RKRAPADAGRVISVSGKLTSSLFGTGRARLYARRLAQQVLDAVALFKQFLKGMVHALARECVDLQAFNAGVFAVFSGNRYAINNTFGNAVRAVGGHTHGDPFAVGTQHPIAHVVDGSVGGRSG